MAKISIRNGLIVGLASWLNELELIGYQSRERSRFIQKLVERYNETEKFRKELLNKYAKKDEKGESVLSEDKNSVVLDDQVKYVEEVEDLYKDEYVVELDDKAFKTLKDVVLNTNYIFGPKDGDSQEERAAKVRQANDYNAWCECFEGVKK